MLTVLPARSCSVPKVSLLSILLPLIPILKEHMVLKI
jgi:hypothetical protein